MIRRHDSSLAGSGAPTLQLRPLLPEVSRVDAWWSDVAAASGVPGEVADELRVCLHELVGNIVMHGGPGVTAIVVAASAQPDEIRLTVEDDGLPFDPTAHPEPPTPRSVEAAPIGGLGLLLVRRFTDAFGYNRLGCRNRVTVSRRFSPALSETQDSA